MYKARVCRIKVKPHPNADKIQLGEASGFQVVVGLDTKDGDLGIFFPTDGQLSDEYCKANNLYPVFDELTGKKIGGGFIDPNKRRVQAQGFRGEKSYGLWMPISSLDYIGSEFTKQLSDGDELTEWTTTDGTLYPICNRYETKATLKAARTKSQGRKQPKTIMFKEHIDTAQFKYNVDKIPVGSLVTITEKLHGTSGRYGRVLVDKPLPFWAKVLNYFGCEITNKEWSYLNGTRRVILGENNKPGFYGTDAFRYEATQGITLYKGECLFFELVGYYSQSNTIMPIVKNSPLGSEFTKRYGDYTTFSYGCVPGQCDLYIYRITRLNEDGIETELSWNQVRERCKELGLKCVPQIAPQFFWHEGIGQLTNWIESLTDGSSTLNVAHIREGVVIRVDQPDGETKWYKNKSHNFYVLEGIIKTEEVVDMEEMEDLADDNG